jgi:lipopolysaccharide/colanic/teichoic acid biosynthesis glycosyltransferase
MVSLEMMLVDHFDADQAVKTAGVPARNPRMYGTMSRMADVMVAGAVIIFILPLLVLISALVWFQDGGSPIYAQERIGRGGRVFRCYKFRSMVVDARVRLERLLTESAEAREEWERDHKLRHDPRITPVGAFLRKSSLDELPQLFNVLAGTMSLVGPRPIVAAEVSRYGHRILHYYAVRPGITGLWQISGRNDVSYRRRVALDCAYVKNRSLILDVKILTATVPAVLMRKGSY